MTRFKKIVSMNPISPPSRTQIEKCAQKINFSGIFMDSIEEACSIQAENIV